MRRVIFLDTTPLGLATQRKGKPEADACRAWIAASIAVGTVVCVPEIADYEVRRELLRIGNDAGISRLDAFLSAHTDRFVPITTAAMRKAAELWAIARNAGTPTADPLALDGDVILAAQTLEEAERLGLNDTDFIIATSNSRHLVQYVPNATDWQNIVP